MFPEKCLYDDVATTENIPKNLNSTYMELVAANSAKRPNPREKIKILSSGPNAFFKNDIIEVCTFLEELQIKDDHEKSRFWTSLPSKLDNIPEHVCVHKILPECIKAFDFSNAGAVILAPVFKIGKFLNTDDYQARIVPCIVKLFRYLFTFVYFCLLLFTFVSYLFIYLSIINFFQFK